MFKIQPDSMDALKDLIHDPAALEKWILADIEKYKKE
jgi:hypothetical protein